MLTKNDIKRVALLKNRKDREVQGLFVAEGVKIVEELLLSGMNVVAVYALRSWFEDYTSIFRQFTGRVNFVEIAQFELEKMTGLTTPNSVLAVVEMKRNAEISVGPDDLILALDGISDPGNMGTIIRTASWFGVTKIVCSQSCVDIYNLKVIQATMGAIASVDVYYTDLVTFLMGLKKTNIYGMVLDGDNIYGKSLSNGVIVVGSESHGISSEVKELLSDKLLIPSFGVGDGLPESLNAAVATAITLSEFKRQSFLK